MLTKYRSYRLAHPDLVPPRNVAIDGVINTGLSFYTRRLVYRKLGMFSFVAKPLMGLVESILTKRVIKFCDRVDSIRNRYGGSNSRANEPSAPPAPYDYGKQGGSKFD